MHEITLNYDKPLLRQVVRRFWWRVVGVRFVVALGVCAIGLLWAVHAGDSLLIGMTGTALVLGLAFVIALYATHYRRKMQRLAAMGEPRASLRATDLDLSLSSAAGRASLPWSAITEVWQFPSYWLLFLSPAQFITLPLADLPPDHQAFILQRVRAAGGRIG